MSRTKTPDHPNLDRFVSGYVECMFFTDAGPDHDIPAGMGVTHLAVETVAQIRTDCAEFIANNLALLEDAWARVGYSAERAGHDFWLTRNGHGAGFWDRDELYAGGLGTKLSDACQKVPERDLYVGDDDKLYLS
jgi:hypothetical protein